MRKFKIVILLLLPFMVSGCIDSINNYFIRKFMDGPTSCKSTEMNKVVSNRRAMRNISNGLNRSYIRYAFGNLPDKTELLSMRNGSTYLVDHYQVAPTEICGGKSILGGFDRIIYLDGVVIGDGKEFYKNKIEPYIVSSKFVH